MNSKKANIDNDDLKFTPLDINSPLNMGNSKLNSITTPNALDGISINSDLYRLPTFRIKFIY